MTNQEATYVASETVKAKARRLLTDQRVRVVQATPGGQVLAWVRGDTDQRRSVRYDTETQRFVCSCPARVRCAHVEAISMIVERQEAR